MRQRVQSIGEIVNIAASLSNIHLPRPGRISESKFKRLTASDFRGFFLNPLTAQCSRLTAHSISGARGTGYEIKLTLLPFFGTLSVLLKQVLRTAGEVSEWLKEHAWKACVRRKAYRGFESRPLRQTRRTRLSNPEKQEMTIFHKE